MSQRTSPTVTTHDRPIIFKDIVTIRVYYNLSIRIYVFIGIARMTEVLTAAIQKALP